MIVEKCLRVTQRERIERAEKYLFLELNPNAKFLDALITRDARGKIILGKKRYDGETRRVGG